MCTKPHLRLFSFKNVVEGTLHLDIPGPRIPGVANSVFILLKIIGQCFSSTKTL